MTISDDLGGALLERDGPRVPVASYVALGDSFTAGTGCEPGEAWAERLATAIRAGQPRLRFRNLAVHGAASVDVLEQLPAAAALAPDLVTVVCGANDVLRSTRPDVGAYAERLATIFAGLREANAEVRLVTATAPESWDFLDLRPRTRERVEGAIAATNAATRTVAAEFGAACLGVAGHSALADPANFASDGLHPSALGHRRVARGFAALVEQEFEIECEQREGAQ